MQRNEIEEQAANARAQQSAIATQQAAISRLEKVLADEGEAQGKLLHKIATHLETATAAPSLVDNRGR